jgi:hypothetical protein
MPEVNVTPEDVRQSDALGKAIDSPGLEALDLCATWRIVKPFWPWIIKAVQMIPTIGSVIGKALELIGNGLDAYCKTK